MKQNKRNELFKTAESLKPKLVVKMGESVTEKDAHTKE